MYDSLRSMSTSSLSSRIGVSLQHATPAFTIRKPAVLMHFILRAPAGPGLAHSVANPCMKFVFDVVEAFSPCSWTGLLGGYYLEFFPKTIGIYHVLAACRGESPPSEEAAAMQDGIVFFALAAMVFMWAATYHGLDDMHTRLKNKLYANALSAVCDPYRPHVLAATLVWVTFKGLMCFGRPLHVFSSNMTSDNLRAWPQIVMCIFWWDCVLNFVWIVQAAVGTCAPPLNSQRKFVYHTAMTLVPVGRDAHDTTLYENTHVEAIHWCRMLSSCREDANTISSMDCEAYAFAPHENELAFKLVPYFRCVMSRKAICYRTAGAPTVLVGREARESDEAAQATRKTKYEANLAEVQRRHDTRAAYAKKLTAVADEAAGVGARRVNRSPPAAPGRRERGAGASDIEVRALSRPATEPGTARPGEITLMEAELEWIRASVAQSVPPRTTHEYEHLLTSDDEICFESRPSSTSAARTRPARSTPNRAPPAATTPPARTATWFAWFCRIVYIVFANLVQLVNDLYTQSVYTPANPP